MSLDEYEFEVLKHIPNLKNMRLYFHPTCQNNMLISETLKRRLETFGSFEECRELQQKMAYVL